MANRNDSDARQHETLPGPGPGTSAPAGGGGRPVEQMVDAAIERIAVERTVRDRGGSVELARRSAAEASLARRDAAAQALRAPTRLRWKGIDVSDEFRQYAERIARGEDLPPFEGRVLAEPHPAFPWGGDGAVAEPEPKARGTHPAAWGAAILVLGLLGWSVALKLEGEGANASLDTAVAPLAAPPAEQAGKSTPPDVVETPALAAPAAEPATAQTEPAEPSSAVTALAEPAPTVPSPAVPSLAVPSPGVPSPALATPRLDTKAAPASPAPSPAPARASIAVDLARPGALQQAVGAALAGQNGASRAPAASTPIHDDEFGIMAAVSPAPAAPPAATPGAVAAAPAGAKSNGSVGDLARAGQPAGSGVRKEPGSESSAKGSLLVETPSF